MKTTAKKKTASSHEKNKNFIFFEWNKKDSF